MGTMLDHWREAATDAGLSLEADTSEDLEGSWWICAAEYSRTHFLRLLVSAAAEELELRMEVGAPEPERRVERLQRTLPNAPEGTLWDVTPAAPGIVAKNRTTDITWAIDLARGAANWLDAVERDGEDAAEAKPVRSLGLWETLGPPMDVQTPKEEPPRDGEVRFEVLLSPEADSMRCSLWLPMQADEQRLAERLADAIERSIVAKFDLAVASRRECKRGDSVLVCTFQFSLQPIVTQSLAEVDDGLRRYLADLATYQRAGINLLVFFGVVDVEESRPLPVTPEDRRDTSASVELDFGAFASEDSAQDGVGVTLSMGESDRAKPDYHDPQLRQPDSSAPFVDVVLRHPGFSERRTCQVLSILLEIPYTEAVQLVDRAPCVISWRLGLKSAQEMKGLIHATGARVVLLEPNTWKSPS